LGVVSVFATTGLWLQCRPSALHFVDYRISNIPTTKDTINSSVWSVIPTTSRQHGLLTGSRFRLDSGQISNKGVIYFETDQDTLFSFLRRDKMLHLTDGASIRHCSPETEFERALSTTSPLTDMTSAPDERHSKVKVIFPQDEYRVGDTLHLRADLYDGSGRIRTTGGDEVRIWLTSQKGSRRPKPYAVAADVTDMRNGSYIGKTTLQWPGVTYMRVSLTYPREFLRLLVVLRHTLHSMRWVKAIFSDGNGTREATTCLPSFPVPGFSGTCNFTSRNTDVPWYCGHPTIPRLNCSHWTETGNYMPHPKRLTPLLEPTPRETWESPVPRGWFLARSWRPSTCSVPEMTNLRAQQCMRNTTLLFLGDSNMDLFYKSVKHLVNISCANREEQDPHSPKQCQFRHLNSSLLFARHAMPFNVGGHENIRTCLQPQPLQHVSSHGHHQAVVVVHYYVHLSFYPLYPFRDRVRHTRRAVEQLLRQHPKVKVFIRGPHVIYDGKGSHVHFGDNFGPEYIRIWKEEFRGLYDKVWFLDYWDMTIASENFTSHPPYSTVREMLKLLFGYFCESS
ncbi:hypothetical protein BaRGS_00036521, partial [Batillaria attramentaria]